MLPITSLHRVRVATLVALTAAIASLLLAGGLVATADAASYSLYVSTQPDRSSAQSLAGRSFAGSATIHVFTTPTSGVRRVRFHLDDTGMTGAARSTDSSAPFDFNGTSSTGSAIGFSLSSLATGSHTITAAVERNNGNVQAITATFTVTGRRSPAAATAARRRRLRRWLTRPTRSARRSRRRPASSRSR